ncbi:MAG: hypothetical protein VB021_09000 [Oscillospiraceae bacterium]|nr:hypothetical protein [Oscillospiraceae bacterium]
MENKTYRQRIHVAGRIWTVFAILLLLGVPTAVCIRYDSWPAFKSVLMGLLGIIPIFWTIGIIEFVTYVPMLGTAGSYLGFVTGNLANLKVPCALNAMEAADVEPGSEKGEVISTIAIAVSAIVTTAIIAVGVLLLSSIQSVIDSPVLQPAFDNILPALFGGLAVVYVSRNWKIAVAPLVFMLALFIALPVIAEKGLTGVMVPVGAAVAIIAARILYKKGLL